MRRFLALILFFGLVTRSSLGQGKQRFGDSSKPVNALNYPLTLHVSHAFLSGALNSLVLDVTVNGKKLQLKSQEAGSSMLHTGDYKAQIVKDDQKNGGWFSTTYAILLPDGTHWFFNVVSEAE